VPSFDDELAFAIMEEELGRSLGEVFSSISEHPIAAASLGQVCRARHSTRSPTWGRPAIMHRLFSNGAFNRVRQFSYVPRAPAARHGDQVSNRSFTCRPS